MSSGRDPAPAAQQQQQQQQQEQRDADTEMVDQPAPPQPSAAADTEMQAGSDSNPPTHPQPQEQPQEQQGNPDAEQEQQQADRAREKPTPEQQQQQQQQQPPPPPGPRASRLQKLFATTARHTLDKISKDNFAACFPTVAHRAPGTLEFVQRQMVERLGGLWTREFETIMANRQVVARLNELETLVADATRRRLESRGADPPVAPHTLPAPTVLHAHLVPHLSSQARQLHARLRDTQAANAALWDEVRAQRAEVEALLAGVDKALRDVDGANALLGKVADELAAEARAAEADIEAVRSAAAG